MSRNAIRVAAVQPDCSGTTRETEGRVVTLVEKARDMGAEIICLPEHWIPGNHPDLRSSIPVLAKTAARLGAYIIAGADFVKSGRSVTVDSVIIGPKGEEIGRQSKTHLFGRERRYAVPGSELSIFDLAGVNVGVAICHDLVYPEVARILALKGAELIAAPAKIGPVGWSPWSLYVKARALENRVPIVSPNVLDPPRFMGESMIVGLSVEEDGVVYPAVLERAASKPKVIVADIDLAQIRRYRRERLRARRPEIYSDLWTQH